MLGETDIWNSYVLNGGSKPKTRTLLESAKSGVREIGSVGGRTLPDRDAERKELSGRLLEEQCRGSDKGVEAGVAGLGQKAE